MSMEQRLEQRQQPRQRANQRQMGNQTMQARQDQQDEVRQWERDWRTNITENVRGISSTLGDTVAVVREMQGDVRELLEWKAGLDKRRDDRDDKRPDRSRADLAIIISACIGGLSLLEAMVGLIYIVSQHWK